MPLIGRHEILAVGAHVLQIVKTKIEVNDIPGLISQPIVKLFHPFDRWTAIGQRTMDICLPFKHLPDRNGVTN